MKTVLRIVVLLPGVLFVVMGVRWLVGPTDMATELGFVLADGVGRSSQVGDFAAFFLTAGICTLMGVVTAKRFWFYPPAMLLLLAAAGRVLAWALHDAVFAVEIILFEVIIGALLLAATRWIEPVVEEERSE